MFITMNNVNISFYKEFSLYLKSNRLNLRDSRISFLLSFVESRKVGTPGTGGREMVEKVEERRIASKVKTTSTGDFNPYKSCTGTARRTSLCLSLSLSLSLFSIV